jgi:fructose-bisphosphate aldolase class II
MALEKVSDILKDADKRGTAVIAFDTFNFESIAWLIEAAEELQIPVIQMLFPAMKSHIPFEAYAKTVKTLAKKVKIPIGLHLDHSKSYEEILQAIHAGFTSVMFDGSTLPYEENVMLTSKVVEAAHAMGIDVEAELGKVGFAKNKDDFTNRSNYTKPEEAKDFIEKTGVDYLAVSFGSAHGLYIEQPKLDLELLTEINAITDTPLVLHGGTGIPDEQLQKAFGLGINKLNVGTELNLLFYSKTKELVDGNSTGNNYGGFLHMLKDEIVEYYRNKISLTKI